MNKHKHADAIHAWADGAEIEVKDVSADKWISAAAPWWFGEFEYRIKPHRWQKEIDAQKAGKAVQYRAPGNDTWRDGEVTSFDALAFEFRIKPETIRYRVAIFQHAGTLPYTMTVDNGHQETKAPECIGFVKWLGDWQEVEA